MRAVFAANAGSFCGKRGQFLRQARAIFTTSAGGLCGGAARSSAIDAAAEDADVRQVAVAPRVVHAAADHEHVLDREADEVRHEGDGAAGGLVEQGGDAHRARPARGEQFFEAGEGTAAVDDVLDDEHVPPGDGDGQVLPEADLPRGRGARAVGGEGQKVDLQRQGQGADEVGKEGHAPFQDADGEDYAFADDTHTIYAQDAPKIKASIGLAQGKDFSFGDTSNTTTFTKNDDGTFVFVDPDADFAWRSTAPDVAAIDKDGNITPTGKAGEASFELVALNGNVEVDGASITADKVKIPRKWDDSFTAFNTVVEQSGLDLARCKGKTVEKWQALIPAASDGEESCYGVLLVHKKKPVGAYLLAKPSGFVTGLRDAQSAMAAAAEQAAETAAEAAGDQAAAAQPAADAPAAADESAAAGYYIELPIDAGGYPVE